MSHKDLEAPPECKFLGGDHVKHVKSGGVYAIRWSPADNFVIEATVEPAYVYESVSPHQNTRWIRPQSEMEDGRFVISNEST